MNDMHHAVRIESSQRFPRLFATVLALCSVVFAGSAVAELPEALREALAERIKQEMDEQNIVGLSAGFVLNGEVAGTSHFGWACRDEKIPASDDTLYRWASISKPLTAIAAMQLVEQDRLDLQRDVRAYVPEFPEKPWTITSKQLLSHQGGVVHYSNGPVIRTEREYDTENPFECTIMTLDNFKRSPLVCEPGSEYSYTTHGYLLLAAVVERAGEQTYPEQVRQRIIKPLGMTTLQPDYQWKDIPHRAEGYRRNRDGEIIASTNTDVSWKLGGGGWISNVEDLALLGVGMLGEKLVKSETRDRMWTRQHLANGDRTGYGLGFRVRTIDGTMIAEHGGSQEKTRTRLIICPTNNLAVALMCNTERTNLTPLANDVLRMLREAAAEESPYHAAP